MNEEPSGMNPQNSFDPAALPLAGTRLIEASAGTGKTWNIANFFLRLVLGHKCTARKVDEILVVTFTRAATAELKGRIRERIEQAFEAFRRGESGDDFIRGLIPGPGGERSKQLNLLRAALLGMDEASISTIHSFAVKAARTFLFETGSIADIEITEAGTDAGQQIASDLYRRLATLPGEQAAGFFEAVSGQTFDKFRQYFGSGISQDAILIPDASDIPGIEELYRDYVGERSALEANHERLAAKWEQFFPASLEEDFKDFRSIEAIFNQGLNDAVPAKYKLSGNTKGLVAYLCRQLSKLSIEYGKKPTTGYYRNWLAIPNDAGSGEYFDFLLELRKQIQDGFEFSSRYRQLGPAVLSKAILEVQDRLPLDEMSADDVIRLIRQKLEESKTADSLRQIITQTYPVCLVDEFQDTDPEQFSMFNQIYEGAESASGVDPDTGFFMIGDPKQSIYAFRGADIFSYLRVREKVRVQQEEEGDQKIFSLTTNWRSKAALVDATNALFREPPQRDEQADASVFIFPGIEYQPVVSCEDTDGENKGAYSAGGQLSSEPLVFIGNPESGPEHKIIKGELLRKYARDTADRISALLDRDSGGSITREDGSVDPIRPGDIAVLVRSGYEARSIRAQLARPGLGIRSVYLSQRDSVFSDAEISEDLYHILAAFNESSDKRRLKSALATPLLRGFGFDFREICRLEDDDDYLEECIENFTRYAGLWKDHGILTALNRLYDDFGLFDAIAQQPDSDRLYTDLRHLGDLLQQQDLQCSSAEQLIDWYTAQLNDDSALDEDAKRIRLESDEDLVKIVTIHVSKGLQYSIVFLPFFFLPWKVDLEKSLPLYHDKANDFAATYDFSSDAAMLTKRMTQESRAEDMRLLYVAVTRAVYQCHIGISAATIRSSKNDVFNLTPWARLLGIESPRPDWLEIKAALEQRMPDGTMAWSLLGEVEPRRFRPAGQQQASLVRPPEPDPPVSAWQVTSYSRLAHGASSIRLDDKGDDEPAHVVPDEEASAGRLPVEDEAWWKNDIRYILKGSALTGNCLHDIFEQRALQPQGDFPALVRKMLFRYGLEKPALIRGESGEAYEKRRDAWVPDVSDWLSAAMKQALRSDSSGSPLSLQGIFGGGQAIAELIFDFAIGGDRDAIDISRVNEALAGEGVDGVNVHSGWIHGLMTGAIDLTFIHDGKVYVLDYKSNTLGKSPAHYAQAQMTECMKSRRYDLQYLIYSTAVHRYFRSRYGDVYAFDPESGKNLSFGGVFYLFLRGMGLDEEIYAEHGVWFTRPDYGVISALDGAFRSLSGEP